MKYRLVGPLVAIVTLLAGQVAVLAGPSSTNYELKTYSFGTGGSSTDTGSPNNKLFGTTGEIEFDPSSPNYQLGGGLAFTQTTNVPQTPSIDNPSHYYDRLHFTLNPGTDPFDTTYAIAISPDNFATTTYYITTGLTLGSSAQYQTYTAWGGSSGAVVTGLDAETTYTIEVKAIEGSFTESGYSPTASAATELPSLTFTVGGTVNMGTWNESNNYSSTANSTLTTSTNAYNGYSIYGFEASTLNQSNSGGTIANYSGTYANPKSWVTGTGFGYTTNDTDISSAAKWNQNPCPGDGGSPLCYAAFSQTGPGDVIADHEANLSSGGPITNEQFNVTYKVATTGTQPAGQYATSIVYTVAPIY